MPERSNVKKKKGCHYIRFRTRISFLFLTKKGKRPSIHIAERERGKDRLKPLLQLKKGGLESQELLLYGCAEKKNKNNMGLNVIRKKRKGEDIAS